MSAWIYAVLVGLVAGTHTATWGMYKDAPHEGFAWRKYSRSIFVAALLAPLAAAAAGLLPRTAGSALALFGLTYGLERAVVEFYKTFLREEDQSKYTIPMQFHVFGRVVHDRGRRLAIGGAVVIVISLVAAFVWRFAAGRELDPLAVFLVGGVGGWVSAFGGAWKDAPIEGFHWLKFWRSPLLAGSWALVVSRFTNDIVVIAIAALGFTVATTETYKTFFFPSRPRGKFQGKPVLYPDLLRFRQRFVPLYTALWLLIVLALAAALDITPVRADGGPVPLGGDEVPIDMSAGWLRRDWQACSDPTRITFEGGVISFDSRASSALVWQVPTKSGPLLVDPTLGWVRSCERAPIAFFRTLAARDGAESLVDLSEHPYLHWRWRVDGGVEDSRIARPDGRIRRGYDDFAAKLGVLVQAQHSDEVHEIAYVWARSCKVGTVLQQETTVVPLIHKLRAARLVVETGRGFRTWVEEVHDVRADFARLVPGQQAGRVLRVYLMTDSDDTRGSVGAEYADIRFLRSSRTSTGARPRG